MLECHKMRIESRKCDTSCCNSKNG